MGKVMADSSQLKRVDPADLGDDDPFAELTKIMGFDPRVPVRPGASSAPARPQAEESVSAAQSEPDLELSSDDFSIDLEKELLGDFAIDDEAVAAAPPSLSVQEQAFQAAAPSHADSLDHDMAFAADLEGELLRDDQPRAVDAVSGGHAAEPEAAAPEVDEGDFDLAFAADIEDELLQNHVEPTLDDRMVQAHQDLSDDIADASDLDGAFTASLEDELLQGRVEPAFDEREVQVLQEQSGDPVEGANLDGAVVAGLEDELLQERTEPALGETTAYSRQERADDAVDEADFDAAFAVDLDDERMIDSAEPVSSRAGGEEQTVALTDPTDAGELDAAFEGDFAGAGEPEGFDEPVRLEERRHDESEGNEEHELSAEDVELLAALEPDVMEERFDDAPLRAEAPRTAEVDDLDFDVAMADVDMDFGIDAESPRQEGYGVYDGEPLQAGEIDFDDEDGAVFVDEVEQAPPEEAPLVYVPASHADMAEPIVASADITASDEHDQEELSLEDELNALLGNSVPRAELTRGYDAPPLSASVAEHAPSFSAHARDDAVYTDDEEDFAGPSYQVAEVERDDDGNTPVTEEELEFDDHAFDAAFENSLAADEYQEQTVNHDPYASLRQAASQAAPASHLHAAASNWRPAATDEDIPDIETVDVPESAMALADDLDIPELAYEDEVRAAPAFDEFESEFAAVFADQPQAEEANSRATEASGYSNAGDGYGQRYGQAGPAEADNNHLYAAGIAAVATAGAAAYASARPAERRDSNLLEGFDEAALPGSRRPEAHDGIDELDYDGIDEEIALPAYAEGRAAPRRRGLMITAVVGGVVVLGGVGAFALSSGGGGSDVPAIVRADDTPIKVRPENPGGTSVPNQDNKVYETVAGARSGAPTAAAQPKLISSAEEPVDMSAKLPAPPSGEAETSSTMPMVGDEVADLPSGDDEIADIAAKAEDRVDPAVDAQQPATDNTEVAAVTPRRVRTMVVRPDGSLVPREDPAPAAAAEPQAAAEAMMETAPSKPAAEPQVTNTTKPAQAPAAAKQPAKAASTGTPATVPVAPARPADQPLDVVGEVKPEQVAAVSQGAAAGGWSMQIASQPSEDAAKSTYQDLARRYASVIGGRGATIVKAEIAGKGTFWRVRIPAGSRNEAVSLCESYKSAGGNCFVSK